MFVVVCAAGMLSDPAAALFKRKRHSLVRDLFRFASASPEQRWQLVLVTVTLLIAWGVALAVDGMART